MTTTQPTRRPGAQPGNRNRATDNPKLHVNIRLTDSQRLALTAFGRGSLQAGIDRAERIIAADALRDEPALTYRFYLLDVYTDEQSGEWFADVCSWSDIGCENPLVTIVAKTRKDVLAQAARHIDKEIDAHGRVREDN